MKKYDLDAKSYFEKTPDLYGEAYKLAVNLLNVNIKTSKILAEQAYTSVIDILIIKNKPL